MSEVGVLNLTIKDNSEQATAGLLKLADALSRVKTAVNGGLKLSGVSTQITRIAKAVNDNINSSTISMLSDFADAMSKLQGIGSVTINIGTGKLDSTVSAAKAAKTNIEDIGNASTAVADKISEDFSNVESAVETPTEAVKELQETIRDVSGEKINLNEKFDVSTLPMGQLGMKIRDAQDEVRKFGGMAKDALETNDANGVFDKVTGSTEEATAKTEELATATEETVRDWDDLATRIKYADEYEQHLAQVMKENAAAAKEMRAQQVEIEKHFNDPPVKKEYSMEETNAMADNLTELDLLKAKLREAEEQYNKFVNTLGTDNSKTIKSGLAVSNLRDKIRQYEDALRQAREEAQHSIEVNTGNETAPIGPDMTTTEHTVEIVDELNDKLQETGTLSGTINSILNGTYKEANADGQLYSETLQKINDGTYQMTQEMPGASVAPHLDEYASKLDLLREKYTILEDELANHIEIGDWDDKKIVNTRLQMMSLVDQIERLENRYAELGNEDGLISLGDAAVEAANEFMNTHTQIQMVEDRIEELKAKLGNGIITGKMNTEEIYRTVGEIDRLKNKLESLKQAEEQQKSTALSLKASFISLKDSISKMFPGISGLIKQFERLAIRMALRSAIKQVTSAFSEGIENVYHYSSAVGTSFHTSMDNAATSLSLLKNSIGAAAAPLLESLIPALQTLVNWLVTGINYVNQFFSLLNGQSTWTKALATQVDAYTDSTNKTKKATNSLKELLADWDELNIIQSTSSSSGSGTGVTVDYSAMFEETSEYEDWVKDLTNYLKNHMEDILDLVKAIGIAILAWKLSNAFSGVLSDLLKITAGATLLVEGIKLSYSGGLEAGKEGGFDGESILTSAAGMLAAAVGGSIITNTLGLGSGIGFAVGVGAGLVATLWGYIEGLEDFKDRMKWGNITWTQEEIKAYVQSLFKFDINAEIDVLSGNIKTGEEAQRSLNQKITDFSKGLKAATISVRVKNDYSAIADAGEKAAAVVDEISAYLETNNKTIKALLETVPIIDDQGQDQGQNILENITIADQSLEQWFKDQGKQIADWIDEGTKTGWKNNEADMALALMSHTQDVLKQAEENRSLNQLQLNAKGGLAMLSRDNVQEALKETQGLLEQYKNDAIKSYNNTIADLRYRADIAKGAGLWDTAKLYNDAADQMEANYENAIKSKIEQGTETLRKEWIEALKKVYGGDISNEFDFLSNFDELPLSWIPGSYVDPATEFAQRLKEAKAGDNIEEAKQAFTDYMKYLIEQVDPNHIALDASDLFNFSTLDIVSEQGLQKMVQFLSTNLGEDWTNQLLTGIGFTPEAIAKAANAQFASSDQVKEEIKNSVFSFMQGAMDTSGEEISEEAIIVYMQNLKKMLEPQGLGDVVDEVFKEIFNGRYGDSLHDAIGQMMVDMFPDANMDLLNRKILDFGDHVETMLTTTFTASKDGSHGLQWVQDLVMSLTPITPDGKKLTDEEFNNYVEELLGKSASVDELFANDKLENGGLGLLISADADFENFDDAVQKAEALAQQLHEFQESYYLKMDSTNFQNGASKAATSVEDMVKRIRESIDKLNGITFNLTSDGGVLSGIITTYIPQTYATGGFPTSGDMFMANENGNIEMMGKMGNRAVVANNQQIVSGISAGVENANSGIDTRMSNIETMLARLMNKQFVATAVPSSSWGRHNAQSNQQYNKVTGY